MQLNFLRKPSLLQIVVAELDHAERERLTNDAHLEYHTGVRGILNARIVRLRAEVTALNNQVESEQVSHD